MNTFRNRAMNDVDGLSTYLSNKVQPHRINRRVCAAGEFSTLLKGQMIKLGR